MATMRNSKTNYEDRRKIPRENNTAGLAPSYFGPAEEHSFKSFRNS